MADYGKIEELSESLKMYINTIYELNKLEAAKRSSTIGAGMVSSMIVGLIAGMSILFLSLGLSFYLSNIIGEPASGFGIVGAFYLLLAVILMLSRRKIIEHPMRDIIISKLLSKN